MLRVVVNQPAILVLDEPENNLDQRALESLVVYLQKLKGRCTVLLVTHGSAFHALVDHTLDLSVNPVWQAATNKLTANGDIHKNQMEEVFS